MTTVHGSTWLVCPHWNELLHSLVLTCILPLDVPHVSPLRSFALPYEWLRQSNNCVFFARNDGYAPCVRCSSWKCQAGQLSGYIKNLLVMGEIPHHSTFASINQRLRQPGLLNAQNMAVDGEGLSALRGLRKRFRTWLITLPQPALADLGNPYIHSFISIQPLGRF